MVAPRLASPVTPEARDRVQVETLEGVEMAMLRCVGVKGRGRWSREHRMGPEESKAMFVCFGEWALSACHRLRYIATSRQTSNNVAANPGRRNCCGRCAAQVLLLPTHPSHCVPSTSSTLQNNKVLFNTLSISRMNARSPSVPRQSALIPSVADERPRSSSIAIYRMLRLAHTGEKCRGA